MTPTTYTIRAYSPSHRAHYCRKDADPNAPDELIDIALQEPLWADRHDGEKMAALVGRKIQIGQLIPFLSIALDAQMLPAEGASPA